MQSVFFHHIIWFFTALLAGIVSFLLTGLLLHRVWIQFVSFWTNKRTQLYRSILMRWMEGSPADYSQLLRPRMIGDRFVIESLLIEFIQQMKGQLRKEAIEICENIGLIQHRLKQLKKTKNPYRLASIIDKLGLLGSSSAVPELIPFLGHLNAEIRFVTARSLSRIGDSKALAPLLQQIQARPASEVGRYAHLMKQFGMLAVPYLDTLLQDPEPLRRWMAVTVLGEIRDTKSGPILLSLVTQDPDPEVRAASAKAIAQIGTLDCIPHLIHALKDSEPLVRISAVKAFSLMPSADSIQALEQSLHDMNWQIRAESARSLFLLGNSGIEVLRRRQPEMENDLQILIEDLSKR